MSLRLKMFFLPALAIAAVAVLVAAGTEQYARRQFLQAGQQRTQTLSTQFQRALAQRGDEVVRTVQSIADSEATLRMALDLSRAQADPSIYANDAHGLVNIYHLDFLELTAADGTLISSAQWAPASGYRNDWVANTGDWNRQGAFLSRVSLPDTVELGLLAVRAVRVGESNLYVIGGLRFDNSFLRTVAVPDGMRALLYANLEPRFVPSALSNVEGPVAQPEQFASLIESMQNGENTQPETIQAPDQGGTETFVAVPLAGRGGERVAALLIGSSQGDLAALVKYLRILALAGMGFGVLFGLALAWWVSAGVSRPLAQLAQAAKDLQSGKLSGGNELRPRGVTAPVTAALNDLSTQITRERERIVQRERVAARREMSRRFARELKESIFPLHMAVEDLVQAREESSGRFEAIFFECNTAMRAELDRLKNSAARFGEFGRAARPRQVPLGVNEITLAALKGIEPQLNAPGRPPVTPEVQLSEPDPVIEADPDQLRSALENLLLHCLEAMPAGGSLAVRTQAGDSSVRIEVAAIGASLSVEDCQRVFAPNGATPEGMTGLGLATAHAVVTDHGGRIAVESTPGAGLTVRLDFASTSGRSRTARSDTPRQTKAQAARSTQMDRNRPAKAEAAPTAPAAIFRAAPTGASQQQTQEAPVAETAPEPVPITVLNTAAPTATEVSPAPTDETTTPPEMPKDPSRPFRGLTFTA